MKLFTPETQLTPTERLRKDELDSLTRQELANKPSLFYEWLGLVQELTKPQDINKAVYGLRNEMRRLLQEDGRRDELLLLSEWMLTCKELILNGMRHSLSVNTQDDEQMGKLGSAHQLVGFRKVVEDQLSFLSHSGPDLLYKSQSVQDIVTALSEIPNPTVEALQRHLKGLQQGWDAENVARLLSLMEKSRLINMFPITVDGKVEAYIVPDRRTPNEFKKILLCRSRPINNNPSKRRGGAIMDNEKENLKEDLGKLTEELANVARYLSEKIGVKASVEFKPAGKDEDKSQKAESNLGLGIFTIASYPFPFLVEGDRGRQLMIYFFTPDMEQRDNKPISERCNDCTHLLYVNRPVVGNFASWIVGRHRFLTRPLYEILARPIGRALSPQEEASNTLLFWQDMIQMAVTESLYKTLKNGALDVGLTGKPRRSEVAGQGTKPSDDVS